MKMIKLTICLIVFVSIFQSSIAKTIEVRDSTDSGAGTLREAISLANSNDTIIFGSKIKRIYLSSVSFVINKSVTITGNVLISWINNNSLRVFDINGSGITVTLKGITFKAFSDFTEGFHNFTSATRNYMVEFILAKMFQIYLLKIVGF